MSRPLGQKQLGCWTQVLQGAGGRAGEGRAVQESRRARQAVSSGRRLKRAAEGPGEAAGENLGFWPQPRSLGWAGTVAPRHCAGVAVCQSADSLAYWQVKTEGGKRTPWIEKAVRILQNEWFYHLLTLRAAVSQG